MGLLDALIDDEKIRDEMASLIDRARTAGIVLLDRLTAMVDDRTNPLAARISTILTDAINHLGITEESVIEKALAKLDGWTLDVPDLTFNGQPVVIRLNKPKGTP